MLRPCFLVVDREQSGSISTRKLVIETAKFNVLTAYSGAEALESLARFPNVDGVVIDAGLRDMGCEELHAKLRALRPNLTLVVVGASDRHPCPGESFRLESFDPTELLTLLQRMHPQTTTEILNRNAELAQS